MRASFSTMQSTIAGDAALEVEAAGAGLFDEELAAQLVDIEGVRAAAAHGAELARDEYPAVATR